MLIGQYSHTLDPKKRLSLPSKFRKELGRRVVITNGLDACLFVYPLPEWKKVAEKLGELSIGASDTRGFNRFMLAGATEADVDGAGRVLIPAFLTEFAGLKDKVVLVGVSTRVEIWDDENWKAYKSRVEKDADKLAEKLSDIGAL